MEPYIYIVYSLSTCVVVHVFVGLFPLIFLDIVGVVTINFRGKTFSYVHRNKKYGES